MIQNGMCYADSRTPVLKIVEAKCRGGYKLDVLFSNGDRRLFDGRKLLDGEVDVAPEFVYENSIPGVRCEISAK